MHKGFPKHVLMGTARMKQDTENEEEDEKRKLNMEISAAKKRSPVGLASCSSGLQSPGVATSPSFSFACVRIRL